MEGYDGKEINENKKHLFHCQGAFIQIIIYHLTHICQDCRQGKVIRTFGHDGEYVGTVFVVKNTCFMQLLIPCIRLCWWKMKRKEWMD